MVHKSIHCQLPLCSFQSSFFMPILNVIQQRVGAFAVQIGILKHLKIECFLFVPTASVDRSVYIVWRNLMDLSSRISLLIITLQHNFNSVVVVVGVVGVVGDVGGFDAISITTPNTISIPRKHCIAFLRMPSESSLLTSKNAFAWDRMQWCFDDVMVSHALYP